MGHSLGLVYVDNVPDGDVPFLESTLGHGGRERRELDENVVGVVYRAGQASTLMV